jgi:uncharacterized membrane protein YhaH (DUF805 family)
MKKNILSLKFFFNPRGVINSNQFDFGFIVLMTVLQGLLFFLQNQEFIIVNAIILLPIEKLWTVLLPAIIASVLFVLLLSTYSLLVIAIKRFRDIHKDNKKMSVEERLLFFVISVIGIILIITDRVIFIPALSIPIVAFSALRKSENKDLDYEFIEPKLKHYLIPAVLWVISLVFLLELI